MTKKKKRLSSTSTAQFDPLMLKFSLETISDFPPPWPFERVIAIDKDRTFHELQQCIVHGELRFEEPHGYSFFLKGMPFDPSSITWERGLPRNKIPNPTEIYFRYLHFYVFERLSEECSEKTSIDMEALQRIINVDFNDWLARKNTYPWPKNAITTKIRSEQLPVGHEFAFVFDYGDLWEFTCTVLSTPPHVHDLPSPIFGKYLTLEARGDPIPQYGFEVLQEKMARNGKKVEEQSKNGRTKNQHSKNVSGRRNKRQKHLRPHGKFLHVHESTIFYFFRTNLRGETPLVIEMHDPRMSAPICLFFYLDLFLKGITDFMIVQTRESVPTSMLPDPVTFACISREEALRLLTRAWAISNERRTSPSPEAKYWLAMLGVMQRPLKSSPYKCYLCEKRDIPRSSQNRIKKLAKQVGSTDTSTRTVILDHFLDFTHFLCPQCRQLYHH